MKFSVKDFFSKCEQILRKLRICSHLLKKTLMENFIFCAVYVLKKHGENVDNPSVKIYVKKKKELYSKLKLETIKLLGSTEKKVTQDKNG